MTMEKVFEKLRALQDVLSRKFETQNEMEEIPQALATKVELLNRLKKSYTEKSDDHEEKIRYINDLRNKAIEAERLRESFEKQMDLIQTQREYEALDKEIKDAGEKEQELRRDLQKEEELLDEMKLSLEKEEMMIQQQEEEVKEEQERIKVDIKAKETQLKSLKREEKKITPGLDEEILFKFERIIKNKSGLGIVPVEAGVCTGCHMILTSEYVNVVRRGDGIMFCPNCSRIIFYLGEDEQGDGLEELNTIDEVVEDESDYKDDGEE